jgi:hypothetical protein
VSLKIGCYYPLKTDPDHKINLTQSNKSDVPVSAYGTARSTVQGAPLSSEELREIDEYWRAGLYLCLGMEALFVGYGYTPYFVEGKTFGRHVRRWQVKAPAGGAVTPKKEKNFTWEPTPNKEDLIYG